MITVRNPHSVLAALKRRPKDVLELTVPAKGATDAWNEAARLAQGRGIPVRSAAGSGGRPDKAGGRVGATEARIRPREGISAEELFEGARDRAGGKGLWLALDSLQDPHNVGAIFRTAAFFGVQGILLTQERSAPISETAYDVASGGVEEVPFVLQTNLQRGFEVAKEAGLWILGTSEHAQNDISTVERDRPWLLVLGNEEKGMRRLTEETCDVLCGILPHGEGVTSLNVSVAAGIAIAALSR
ncbi:MAG TPA: RNA methyltransferase [Bdellovibrionota bacterium]|nr:RNA methyltransferase [Bdellovibrionota bacterium]